MYSHPKLVKQHAKAMKPKASPTLLEQAKLMRAAKARKRDLMKKQGNLF